MLQCDKLKEHLTNLKNVLDNKDNESPETLREKTNELQQASLKLFETAYKKVGRLHYY